jgi:hypothetical protein
MRFAVPAMQASGFPASHTFRLCRRSTPEATRGLNASAVPRYRFRVAPYSGASVSPTTSARVSPVLHLPAPADEPPELPRFVHPPVSPERIFESPRIFFGLWLLRLSWHQFALALRSFGGAEEQISGSPRISVLQRGRQCCLGFPRFTSAVGSMMNPVCPRTLHPRLAPRMNLQFQSGFAVLPEERCCFNFLRVFTIGKPTANSQCLLILHRCPTRTAVQLFVC